MTGFAAVQGSFQGWTWSADIRAVNGRSLDLRLRLPDVEALEPELRKLLQSKLGRGNVTVQLKLSRPEDASTLHLNDTALIHALTVLRHISNAADAAGVSMAPVAPSDVAAMRGVLDITDAGAAETSVLKDPLIESLSSCIDAFLKDRAREGAALSAILSDQIDQIENLTNAAQSSLGDRETAQKAAIERALAKLLEAGEMPDETR
ncbi:MAG: YicC/YloC family endoribonuclease, partial [Pseudomonadota bacterium]